MYNPRVLILNDEDEGVFRAALHFLHNRLVDQETAEWALRLDDREHAKRLALLRLIEGSEGQELPEPWNSAWRLIEESWRSAASGNHSRSTVYPVRRRLRSGDRSGALVEMIVALVAPRLTVEPLSKLRLYGTHPPRKPRSVHDILLARLSSGRFPEREALDLASTTDVPFLKSLATELETAVARGLNIAERIGWERSGVVRLGQLHRVYYVAREDRPPGQEEPDRFHQGIAPSVKLLSSVLERMAELDVSAALQFVGRWRQPESLVHLRLWAAMARNPSLVGADEVAEFLKSLDNTTFWDLHVYPEIAELRALRFIELAPKIQEGLIKRIRRLPPKKIWRMSRTSEAIEEAQFYWAARELRRIEIGGFALAPKDGQWLQEQYQRFTDLADMARLDEGFLGIAGARWVGANPDDSYETLQGLERLQALEDAFTSSRGRSLDDPAQRAFDWLRAPGKALDVLGDLESVADSGAAYPVVWSQFAATLSPREVSGNQAAMVARVLRLISQLPDKTIQQAIDGISECLFSWRAQLRNQTDVLSIWLRAWPYAVNATNSLLSPGSQTQATPIDRLKAHETDLDSLNTPVGKLVEAFLAVCPDLRNQQFAGEDLLAVRGAIITAQGPSALIARHRLIVSLPYLFHADPLWTEEHLLRALQEETGESLALWQAVARSSLSTDVLRIIGQSMSKRAIDRRLDREVRESLVFDLIVESLFSLFESRAPAVAYSRIQQMLRTVDDDIRAYAADTVRRFVSELSNPEDRETGAPAEDLFFRAVEPFIKDVWPQEHSLVTPGVSRSFASLPAATRGAFAEAVAVVERFLVPFDCWWLGEYGFYRSEVDEERHLEEIDSLEKAGALLRLLILTIGTHEGAVIPDDLPAALERVRQVAPSLVLSPNYRRLATYARRA